MKFQVEQRNDGMWVIVDEDGTAWSEHATEAEAKTEVEKVGKESEVVMSAADTLEALVEDLVSKYGVERAKAVEAVQEAANNWL